MRVVFFVGIVLLGFVAPWWLLGIAAAVYAFRYSAYELVLLGVLLDISLGVQTFSLIPFPCAYTVASVALVLAAQYGKPFMVVSRGHI